MYGYVYKTTHSTTGMYYYGQHSSSVFDETYKGSGSALKKLFKKYHISEWDVVLVKEASSKEELDLLEEQYIGEAYKTDPLCVNMRKGGMSSGKKSEETIQKMRDSFWLVHDESSFINCGRNLSEKGRKKLSDIHLGELNPMFGKIPKNARRIVCVETGEVYDSARAAETATGINKANINRSCRMAVSGGKKFKAGGFYWEYM